MGGRPARIRSGEAIRSGRTAARTDADASEGIRPGPGARHALRPPRHRPGRWPGVIDWQQFGQGPVEFDAGTFLATVWRIGRKDARLEPEAARTEEAFLAGTAGLLNAQAVAWYRAAMLLRLADKYGRRGGAELVDAHALLSEAVRQTGAAG